jgi:hypothetical protein
VWLKATCGLHGTEKTLLCSNSDFFHKLMAYGDVDLRSTESAQVETLLTLLSLY